MANTKIQSEQIADSAIVTDRIASDAITTAKIADNVGLGGSPTTTTQSASDNSTKIATTAYVTSAVASIIDSAPDTLNTLNEIAAALNDDASFNTTVTNSIAAKLPLAGGTMSGDLNMGTQSISNASTIAGKDLTLTDNTPTIIFTDTDSNADSLIFSDGGTGAGSLFLSADHNNEQNGSYISMKVDGAERLQVTTTGVAVTGTISSGAISSTGTIEQYNTYNDASKFLGNKLVADAGSTSYTHPYLDMRRWTGSSANHYVASIELSPENADGNAIVFMHDTKTSNTKATTERGRFDSSGRFLAGKDAVGARSAHTLARTGAFAAEILQQQTSAGASVLGLTYDGAAPNNTTDYFIYAIDNAGIKYRLHSDGSSVQSGAITSSGLTSTNGITMNAGNLTLNSTSDGNQAFRYFKADGTLVGQIFPYNSRYNVQTYNNQGLRLKATGSGQLELEGNVVVNEDSADVNFRVESNANQHALHVEGDSSRVGVGIAPSRNAGHVVVNGTESASNAGITYYTGSHATYRNICSNSTTAGSHRYWHVKTNIRQNNDAVMLVAKFHGYAYGSSGYPIEVLFSGYNFTNNGSWIGSQVANLGGGTFTASQYYSTDDYVVLVLDYVGGYYTGVVLDIETPSPAGNNFDFKVLAQGMSTNSTGLY